MKKFKMPSILVYALPMIIVFSIVMLAYWPGILSPDAMVQWNQVQTGEIDNWHPAYSTIYIFLLTRICNSPAFVIIIQYILIAFIFAYTLTRIEKYYKVNKLVLFFVSCLFALTPLNFNFAVNMLKDVLYSFWILLLIAFLIDIINDKEWLKKWYHCLLLFMAGLLVSLFRHNGIIVIGIMALVLILIYRKEKSIYFVCIGWIAAYLLMTSVGFKILNIKEANYSNKYGPVSHILAKMLNNDKVEFTEEDIENMSEFVDVEELKNTYKLYNMDYSIRAQKVEALKENGTEYLKIGLHKAIQYPLEVVKYYIKTTSFFYSPIPFPESYVAGMFTETELYIYENVYPELKENSKLPTLVKKLKNIENKWQIGTLGIITMRPAIYMYLSIIAIIVLIKKYKDKKILLLILPSLLNMLSLAPAMPVPSTRYVYITMLTFWVVVPWCIYKIYSDYKHKEEKVETES